MSDLYHLGLGYWPDELDEEGKLLLDEHEEEYYPWEDWRLTLFGVEAGDCVEDKKEIDKLLKSLGYKLVKVNQPSNND